MTGKRMVMTLGAGMVILGFAGCASTGKVDTVNRKVSMVAEESQKTNLEISELRALTEMNRTEIARLQETDENTEKKLSDIEKMTIQQKTAIKEELNQVQAALKRAQAAQQLKVGKLLYEVTMSDDSVPFAYKKSELSDDAKSSLDSFASILIAENKDVFIEIQGHTDSIGSDSYNLQLGQERAESVRRYLHTQHGIPLNRMSAFSYGEFKAVAENDTEEGRSKNRRVMMIVME